MMEQERTKTEERPIAFTQWKADQLLEIALAEVNNRLHKEYIQ